MKKNQRTYAWLATLGLVAGCNSLMNGEPDLEMRAAVRSSLLADTNRDGVISEDDRAGKADWTATAGAIFLANLDDDDSKGMADASDEIVNGADDAKDLARIKLVPWATAPATATATITVESALAAAAVRVFRTDGVGWTKLAAPTLTNADLVAGVEFGIEAKNFVQKIDPAAWDGYVVLHLVVTDSALPATAAPVVDDKVKLRVAPYVMVNNLSNLAQLWNNAGGDTGGDAFHTGLMTLSDSSSVDLQDAADAPVDTNGGADQWAEDWWQIGVTFMPGPGGTTQGMRVTQRSAQPDRAAGGFAEMQRGPDVGYIWVHTGNKGQTNPKGYSLDSFGDHDTLPPYSKGMDEYPLGRIIIGGNATSHIDPAVRAFYDAQRVQPVVQVDTTWLLVGHIDEIASYVPAKTPRGWKLLIASPTLARTMLQGLEKSGSGMVKMFTGKYWLNPKTNQETVPAAVTVSALLADAEIMAASDTAAAKIAIVVTALKAELGLTDDEIIEIPILFERIDDGTGFQEVAHMVGTANLRAVNGNIGIPTPHGPLIGGVDFLEKDLNDRLGTAVHNLGADGMGLKITYVEDWDDYHALDGEVHCGSTVAAKPMPNVKWWEAGR